MDKLLRALPVTFSRAVRAACQFPQELGGLPDVAFVDTSDRR
jgi:hypothetical protein